MSEERRLVRLYLPMSLRESSALMEACSQIWPGCVLRVTEEPDEPEIWTVNDE